MIESEVYSELCQTSKVVSFAKIVKSFKRISIFKRNSILDIFDRQDSEYASENIFQLYPKSVCYFWTFESIETSSHFLWLQIQITNWFNNIILSGLQKICVSTHQKISVLYWFQCCIIIKFLMQPCFSETRTHFLCYNIARNEGSFGVLLFYYI